MFGIARTLRSALCLSAVMVIAVGASACSSVPDWVDPTSWMGSSPAASSTSDANVNQSSATDQTSSDGTTVAEASDRYPALADTPDKAPPASSSDERKQVAEGLVADRAQAEYSADALRAGTEPAATPPTPPAAQEKLPETAASSAPDPVAASEGSGEVSASARPADAGIATSDSTADATSDHDLLTGPAPMPGALPPIASGDGASAAAPPPALVPTEASPASEAAAAPAAPATTPSRTTTASLQSPAPPPTPPSVPVTAVPSSDAALGFQPSRAPALDPSVAQFVSPAVLARYQETAGMSGGHGVASDPPTPAATADPAETPAPAAADHKTKKHRSKIAEGTGGPAAMSGAVVANFDGLQPSPAPSKVLYSDGAGRAPAAVVLFPHDTTILSGDARAKVRAAVDAFHASGERGFVKVVGHSSSRTANMPLDRHLVYNFERSQARATAVARELIKEGVPADKVLVEAVGDSQPVYYESMPQGEDGNRRAEIFLQS